MTGNLAELREILLNDSKVLGRGDGWGVDDNYSKRMHAAQELAKVSTPENIGWLVANYRDDDKGDFLCRYIAYSLKQMGTPKATEALEDIATNNGKHWRCYAMEALGLSGSWLQPPRR